MPQVNRPERFERFPAWVLTSHVWDDLTLPALRLYPHLLRLERRQPDGRRLAFGTPATLMKFTGLPERTVSRALTELVSAGLIVRLNRPGRGRASEFGIVRHPPKKAEVSPPPQVVQSPVLPATSDPPLHTGAPTSAQRSRSRVAFDAEA